MKNLSLSFLATFFSLIAFAQTGKKVTIGTFDSIPSKILNEQRKVWVYVPDGYTPESKQRYPVVYLLNGEVHFYSVVGMIQQLSQVNGNTVLPEMIVVGIPNTDRTRDLTPTHIESDLPMMDSVSSKTSGGGARFISFIEKELIPHIDATYPTQPYKMLIGHSFGGLTVMDVLTNHSKLFNSYICIDPSMWWDQQDFLKATKKIVREKNFSGTTLYLGIANTMPDGMAIATVQKDVSDETRQIRSILELDKTLKNQKQNLLRFESKFYANDDHGSTPLLPRMTGFVSFLTNIISRYRLIILPTRLSIWPQKWNNIIRASLPYLAIRWHRPKIRLTNLGMPF